MSALFSTIFLASLVQVAIARPDSIWHVEIFNGPAPPPDEGPPLSASAVRDPSFLWREIVGIVGAYVASVAILLGCLLTVGRRLRRGVQQSNQSLEMEIMKPAKPDPSRSPRATTGNWATPASGTESKSWSPIKARLHKPWSTSSRGPASPISQHGSVATVDESVVQADRERAQEEMERLYAAVMEHDAKQSKIIYDENDHIGGARSAPRSPADIPEFQHLKHASRSSQQSRPPPLAPLHTYAPSENYHSPRHQPTSPLSPFSHRLSRLSAMSFRSSRSRNSTSSNKLRHPSGSIRDLPISPPMGSPDIVGSPYADNEPLSPRLYTPGPPPLTPHQRAGSVTTPVSAVSGRHLPTPLSLRSTGSSVSTLPFRALNPPQSAPATKTTIVEKRDSILRPHAPRTGVPHTPYSPYMPFTPITPITPSRIITKKQRKQMKKENGLRALAEDDLVMSDEDMWGS
ncbi:hypothetical protein AJ80_03764 [Polytolypa hystricis UAMH7299]|uniref:Uncharacterized protein n=1 Tax=Polytolypa hystricis (strain UAMH7299) TaxID=1447883 RepID=A0A2B7YGW1_POLH7|nr:hypothetical protein AJ80_03764 [Polytolypa hystricis UAMH7299]